MPKTAAAFARPLVQVAPLPLPLLPPLGPPPPLLLSPPLQEPALSQQVELFRRVANSVFANPATAHPFSLEGGVAFAADSDDFDPAALSAQSGALAGLPMPVVPVLSSMGPPGRVVVALPGQAWHRRVILRPLPREVYT